MSIKLGHVQRLVGHGHAARRPLTHVPAADVEVQQAHVVVGAVGAGAVAVVDVGRVRTHQVPFQGDGEAPQPAGGAPPGGVGVRSGGPQSPLHLVGVGHRLQGLQQEKSMVLSLSCCRSRLGKVTELFEPVQPLCGSVAQTLLPRHHLHLHHGHLQPLPELLQQWGGQGQLPMLRLKH